LDLFDEPDAMRATRVAKHIVVVALASATIAACSLIDLGDYNITPCPPREPCALNDSVGANECLGIYCRDDGNGCEPQLRDQDRDGAYDRLTCENQVEPEQLDCDDDAPTRAPRRAEDCDGIDNSCDGYIDESASFQGEERSLDEPDVSRVSLAATADGTLHVVLARDDFHLARRIVSGSDTSPSMEALAIGSRCTSPRAGASERCNIDPLVLAAARNVVVAAGIHVSSCGAGQLRLGAASPLEPIPLGDDPAAQVSFGIDIDPDSSQACSRSTECEGASNPALALGPAARPEASEGLLLWQVLSTSECDVPRLAGLGFSIEVADGAFSQLRVDETSTRMTDAPVLGPPVLAALGSIGYVAAFPSEDEVVLLLVSPTGNAQGIEVIDSTHVSAPGAQSVALAAGNLESVGFAVAYRAQVEDRAAIVLESLAVEGARFRRLEPARTFPIDGEIVDGPSLAHTPDGFYSGADASADGGYLLLWVEGDAGQQDNEHRLVGARIAERGLRVLNDRISLADGAIRQVFTYSKHQAGDRLPEFGFRTDRAVHLGSILCSN
jgi:hypothetical protein